jgi:hypothetical protein
MRLHGIFVEAVSVDHCAARLLCSRAEAKSDKPA